VIRSATGHTLRAVAEVADHTGATAELNGRICRITGASLESVLLAVDAALTPPERAEARAVFLSTEAADGDALLDAALAADQLSALAARVRFRHLADLATQPERFHARFQPIVDLVDLEPVAFESLLRASGDDGSELPAGDLFGAAAAGGWTHTLDRIGRETAIKDASGWLGDRDLFINFVPTSIYRPEVCLATTMAAARTHQVPAEQLVFEVVETHRTEHPTHLLQIVEYYRQRGARVALDDVGAGYSSLSLLAAIRPDVVKIDMDLVQRLDDPATHAVVRAITGLSHDVGARTIAEGIETEQQAELARDLGIDLGQGWHFARPMLPAELAAWRGVPAAI
jgi:EAL domain-containing protein (putative c-di-GMP-specific phosphodiesterase class I)